MTNCDSDVIINSYFCRSLFIKSSNTTDHVVFLVISIKFIFGTRPDVLMSDWGVNWFVHFTNLIHSGLFAHLDIILLSLYYLQFPFSFIKVT